MPSSVEVIRGLANLRQWRRSLPAAGRVAFVPTMGALHAGHAELLRRSRARCDVSVLSVFVNPTQFGPNEDLARYPRAFERDCALAAAEGVDVVFAPTPEEMYPTGYSTTVTEERLSGPLCGRFRPGHFRGVTTVVLKLLHLVHPQLALFGLKDAQQFFVLHKMARDLDLDTSIEGVPTVRETDGLALSSRNAYLSTEERQRAPTLYRVLNETGSALSAAEGEAAARLDSARARLSAAGFDVQYLELLSLPELEAVSDVRSGAPLLLAAAAFLGGTRLIDNVILNAGRLGEHGVRVAL